MLSKTEIEAKNKEFAGADPEVVVEWAFEKFGEGLVATSSFQTQSIPLLFVISKVAPNSDVLFLDTGFHFPETHAFLDKLTSKLRIRIKRIAYEDGHEVFKEKYGELHVSNPDKCCYLNKVAPLRKALRGYDTWITGIRRDQSATRRDTPIFSLDTGNILKICPMVDWTHEQVLDCINEHNLPIHPLFDEGYPSIGCAPCTSAVTDQDDPRLGRWKGLNKTECGLHPVHPPLPEKETRDDDQ